MKNPPNNIEKYKAKLNWFWAFIQGNEIIYASKDIYEVCDEVEKMGIYPSGANMIFVESK